ncbi:Zinc finger RING-type [Trinorchestia longiramus]|nr:Zinc finger RING-type [Trinorchestia longiramus]
MDHRRYFEKDDAWSLQGHLRFGVPPGSRLGTLSLFVATLPPSLAPHDSTHQLPPFRPAGNSTSWAARVTPAATGCQTAYVLPGETAHYYVPRSSETAPESQQARSLMRSEEVNPYKGLKQSSVADLHQRGNTGSRMGSEQKDSLWLHVLFHSQDSSRGGFLVRGLGTRHVQWPSCTDVTVASSPPSSGTRVQAAGQVIPNESGNYSLEETKINFEFFWKIILQLYKPPFTMNKETKYCSNCKKEVAVNNFTVHAVHCTRSVALCTVCGAPVPRSQYQHHLQTQHGSIDCPKCGVKIDAVRIFSHQQEECQRRLVACQYCELEVTATEHQKHVDYCGARTERCKGCTKYVQFRHLQFHYNSDHKYLAPEDKDKNAGSDSGDEGSDECPVCLGAVTLPIALECGHVFCMVCVKGIANTTKNCAICRRDIPRDMLMDIRFCREEDVIKNYVNKPRDTKKAFRSQSVPLRSQQPLTRRVTTQDYDDMVSHLLSSRISSTPYRYQRPNNSHTPPSYTPYSYTSNTSTCNTNTSTTGSTNYNDDCCCSASSQQSSASSVERPSVTSTSVQSKTQDANSPCQGSTLTNVSTTVVTSSAESKPKRPTSLALSSSLNESTETTGRRGRREPPPNATQEQYDRWLAFQLAQTDEDIPAAEFNKKHRPVIGRSQSMPERAIAAVTQRSVPLSDSSDSSDDEQDRTNGGIIKRRPPASPRTTSSSQSYGSSSSSYSSSSSLSASSRSPSLTKSSSDSSTSGSSSSTSTSGTSTSGNRSTGARPKSSTGLKKRVSFKEDAPEERRVAPIMLPCEFCDEMFSERDLMRHQTSCDLNETQMPRARRESVTSPLLGSPNRTLTSPTLSSRPNFFTSSAPSNNLDSPVSPASRRKVPPNLPLGSSKRSDHSRTVTSDAHRTPPTSPPPRPPHPPSHSSSSNMNRIRNSPQPNSHELTDSSSDSRPTSVSPCPPHSNNSSSSGISSMASSTRSVSSTPSSSSSASPIPAIVDTPTDIEADFEDDDTPFVRPRRGKLLSSAIGSWRTMSGSKDRFKYTRSNTAPLEDTGDDPSEINPVVNSHSASQLPPLPPRHENGTSEAEQIVSDNTTKTNSHPSKSKPQQVFIKKQKKYKAPQPPVQNNPQYNGQPNTESANNDSSKSHSNTTKKQDDSSSLIRLDSKPMMNIKSQNNDSTTKMCQFCLEDIISDKFQSHQAECHRNPENEREVFFRGSQNDRVHPMSHNSTTSPDDERDSSSLYADECSAFSTHRSRRYERAQSVLDERCFESRRESSLTRANSIKETSRSRLAGVPSMGRRWASREMLFCPRGESSPLGSSGSSFGGSSLIGGKFSSRGWSDHVSMVQEDVKAKLTSAKSLLYDREKRPENPDGESLRPSFVADLRSWLDKTDLSSRAPTLGSSRYRSSSVARHPMYTPSTFGSSTRITSLEYRSPYDSVCSRSPFSAQDTYGSSFRRRYAS